MVIWVRVAPGVLFFYVTCMDSQPPHTDSAGQVIEHDELTPLHPNFVKMVRLRWIIGSMPVVVGALLLEASGALEDSGRLPFGVFIIPVLIVAAILILRVPLRRYQARGFAMQHDRLRVVRGLLFRRDTVVPFGRVQHIDVEQGPLERLYGLGTLVLHTAGNHNAAVALPGLAHPQALAMRDAIREYVKREIG